MLEAMKLVPSVTIYDVPVSNLNRRVEAYKTLFGTVLHSHIVKVKGAFKDQSGENVFLNEFRTVNLEQSKRLWICVLVDGEWIMIRPLGPAVIEAVQISVFQH